MKMKWKAAGDIQKELAKIEEQSNEYERAAWGKRT